VTSNNEILRLNVVAWYYCAEDFFYSMMVGVALIGNATPFLGW
jgi:hypothetical protein